MKAHLRVALADENIFSAKSNNGPHACALGKSTHYRTTRLLAITKQIPYAYKTSFGLGYEGTILSESNVFSHIDNLKEYNKVCKIVDVKKNKQSAFKTDVDSQLNGHALESFRAGA
ncbi:hypothetical protein P4S72_01195 [Vibrio sp. PP-XX7]